MCDIIRLGAVYIYIGSAFDKYKNFFTEKKLYIPLSFYFLFLLLFTLKKFCHSFTEALKIKLHGEIFSIQRVFHSQARRLHTLSRQLASSLYYQLYYYFFAPLLEESAVSTPPPPNIVSIKKFHCRCSFIFARLWYKPIILLSCIIKFIIHLWKFLLRI